MVRAQVAAAACACAALAACAQQPPQVPVAPPPPVIVPGACNAQAAQFAVGRTANEPLAEQARVKAGARRYRIVRPGDMVTMEFDDTRLTLDVNESGKVSRVRCG